MIHDALTGKQTLSGTEVASLVMRSKYSKWTDGGARSECVIFVSRRFQISPISSMATLIATVR